MVLTEINAANKTDYQQKDVYFKFDREVMTNAQDNATIEKTDAEKQQIQVNTMLGLMSVLGDEKVVELICEVLDIDYEELKDKLPTNPETELNDANAMLNGDVNAQQ